MENFFVAEMLFKKRIGDKKEKKWASTFYRIATTLYPCCVPTLGEFKRS
jgi:hypothetical protein